MNPLARDFVSTLQGLGTLPTVYLKVNEQVNDPNCPAGKLGKTISNDQAISSMILRLVNSALYGFPNYIDSIGKGVALIGFQQTRHLVRAASII
ncbi:MAG: HDOD domain-containing protein, partial [Lentisphaeraceae bacterium]|nr:HDOD domain-containing protein [Lentisphaeraceae bacterium]